jgi:hypothetical protein
MFPLRINSKIMTLINSQKVSLDGVSARCKGATYTGHQHRINAETEHLKYYIVSFKLQAGHEAHSTCQLHL